MYQYILSLRMAEKGLPISDDFIRCLVWACEESNQTLNSKRGGRKFTYLSRLGEDGLAVKVRLESQTAVIPTRAVSSITRALLRSEIAPELQAHVYKGRIINASVLEETEVSYANISDAQVVQSVIEVFFGQLPSNSDKEVARETAGKIRDAIIAYRARIKP